MSGSHLIPQSLGGFAWAWTHCVECNNRVGSEIEAAVKRDDSIRHALERELAGESRRSPTGSRKARVISLREAGNLNASFRDGSFELGTTTVADSLVQDQARGTEF